MNLKRILIGESEKSRILSLHENLKTESSKLLMEQDSETTTKYFEEQKKKYSNFPDGKVVPVEGGFAYQTNNGILLYPNGTAYNNQGVKSTENWTDEPYVVTPTATGQSTLKPVSFDDLATDKELRRGNRREVINQRRDDKKQQADRKTRIEKCTTAINNYTTYNLASKPNTDPNKQQYIAFFKANCTNLEEINLKIVGL